LSRKCFIKTLLTLFLPALVDIVSSADILS